MLPDSTNNAFERLRQAGRVRSVAIPQGNSPPPPPRSHRESMLEVVGPVPLPMLVGDQEVDARWYVAAPSSPRQRSAGKSEHLSVVAFGDQKSTSAPPLVRIHSTCFTGDVLGSLRCDCGPQLQLALRQMTESPSGGMVVYMSAHEGRAIGLWSKAAAYLLQDEGLDTYEANRKLGFLDDQRDFRHAAALIKDLLGDRPFHLLTNNPEKVQQMREFGLPHVIQQTHIAGVGSRNQRYLSAKRDHGHEIPASALTCCD